MTPFLYVFLAFGIIWLILTAYLFWMGGTVNRLRLDIDVLRSRIDEVAQISAVDAVQVQPLPRPPDAIQGG